MGTVIVVELGSGQASFLYVGSAESFDAHAQKIAVAFVKVLKHAGIRFGILGARQTSTVECAGCGELATWPVPSGPSPAC